MCAVATRERGIGSATVRHKGWQVGTGPQPTLEEKVGRDLRDRLERSQPGVEEEEGAFQGDTPARAKVRGG